MSEALRQSSRRITSRSTGLGYGGMALAMKAGKHPAASAAPVSGTVMPERVGGPLGGFLTCAQLMWGKRRD